MWRRGQAYSQDLRGRVLAAVDDGTAAREVAVLFKVSVSYVYKALIRRRETGEQTARPQRSHQSFKLAPFEDAIRAEVLRRADATLEELRHWLAETHGVEVSLGGHAQYAAPAGPDAQKKSGRAEEQDRPELARRRAVWRRLQRLLSSTRLVFVDETGTATNMTRRYGRSLRGQRLDGPVPHGHWKSTTFVAGLTARGWIAPYVVDGAMNGRLFIAWVEQMLAPELRPGDLVILDNLAVHKAAAVRGAVTARGARLLFLPPCSPDLNPIEQAFAKLKTLLRTAKERTIEGLWSRIGIILDQFAPGECQNDIANAGYVRSE